MRQDQFYQFINIISIFNCHYYSNFGKNERDYNCDSTIAGKITENIICEMLILIIDFYHVYGESLLTPFFRLAFFGE